MLPGYRLEANAQAATHLPWVLAVDEEQVRSVWVLLLDDCEFGMGADRVPALASPSSNSRASAREGVRQAGEPAPWAAGWTWPVPEDRCGSYGPPRVPIAASNRVPALIRRRPLSPRYPPHAAVGGPDLDDELVAVDTDGRRLADVEAEAKVIGLRLLDGDAGQLGVAGPAGRLAGVGGRVVRPGMQREAGIAQQVARLERVAIR